MDVRSLIYLCYSVVDKISFLLSHFPWNPVRGTCRGVGPVAVPAKPGSVHVARAASNSSRWRRLLPCPARPGLRAGQLSAPPGVSREADTTAVTPGEFPPGRSRRAHAQIDSVLAVVGGLAAGERYRIASSVLVENPVRVAALCRSLREVRGAWLPNWVPDVRGLARE